MISWNNQGKLFLLRWILNDKIHFRLTNCNFTEKIPSKILLWRLFNFYRKASFHITYVWHCTKKVAKKQTNKQTNKQINRISSNLLKKSLIENSMFLGTSTPAYFIAMGEKLSFWNCARDEVVSFAVRLS